MVVATDVHIVTTGIRPAGRDHAALHRGASSAEPLRILALAALPAGGSDAELELVGSWTGMDRYRERRDALVTTFGLGAHVHFAGAVSDEGARPGICTGQRVHVPVRARPLLCPVALRDVRGSVDRRVLCCRGS